MKLRMICTQRVETRQGPAGNIYLYKFSTGLSIANGAQVAADLQVETIEKQDYKTGQTYDVVFSASGISLASPGDMPRGTA